MRKAAALLAIGLLLLLSGCWSRIEVTDLGVVIGMGIDVGERQPVRVTLYLSRSPGGPQEEGTQLSGRPTWVVAREGPTIADAIRHISLASPRRISLHHLRVVLVGEEYGRRGMNDLMDFLSRSPQVRLITRVMVVAGTAQSILETQPHLEALQPVNVAEIIAAKGGPDPRLKELMVARVAESFSGWLYVLHVVDRPARMPGTPEKAVEVGGIALLRSDRVVKVLDRSGGQALLWLDGDPKEIVLSVPCPGDPMRTLSVHVTNGKVSYQPFLTKQQLSYQVTVAGRVDLVNTECGVNVVDPVNRTPLEKQVRDHVTAQIRQAIDTFQETRTDPVAFGKRVELKYPAFWKANGRDWPKVWPKVPVKLSVQITIRNAGLLVAPANRSRYELENAKP